MNAILSAASKNKRNQFECRNVPSNLSQKKLIFWVQKVKAANLPTIALDRHKILKFSLPFLPIKLYLTAKWFEIRGAKHLLI